MEISERDFLALLRSAAEGDTHARDQLYRQVYAELHARATAAMKLVRRGATLQTTIVVNDVFSRLVGHGASISDQHHFRAVAARAMQQVLLDYGRRSRRKKRGAGAPALPVDGLEIPFQDRGFLVAELSLALERFERIDPRAAKLVHLRYFGGATEQEAAQILGLPLRTAQREWEYAKAWLLRELS